LGHRITNLADEKGRHRSCCRHDGSGLHPTSGLDGPQSAQVVTEPNAIIDKDLAQDAKFQTGGLSEPTGWQVGERLPIAPGVPIRFDGTFSLG
jgi:hypothetical protein